MENIDMIARIQKENEVTLSKAHEELMHIVKFMNKLEEAGIKIEKWPSIWGDVVNHLEEVIDDVDGCINALKEAEINE